MLYENISNAFAHFALYVDKNNFIYCGIGGSRLPGRFTITSDPLVDDEAATVFSAILTGKILVPVDVREWATEYIANIEIVIPDYMTNNGLDIVGLFKRYFQRERLGMLKSLMRHAFDSRTYPFQMGNQLRTHFDLFVRNVFQRFKIWQVKRLYQELV